MPPIHRSGHVAMKCPWSFFLHAPHWSAAEAASVGRCLSELLDRLENELSRFQHGSDIHRINSLRAGESTRIGEAAWDCLSLARDMTAESGGAFDISTGPWIELYRHCAKHHSLPPPEAIERFRPAIGPQAWSLSQDGPDLLAHCHHDQLLLDLGAVGKGYALDLLGTWIETETDCRDYLLCASESSLLACGRAPGEEGWPVHAGSRRIRLQDQSAATSGSDVQGGHIIDPRSGRALALNRPTVHVLAPQAAVADALATACFVLDPAEARALIARHPGLALLEPGS